MSPILRRPAPLRRLASFAVGAVALGAIGCAESTAPPAVVRGGPSLLKEVDGRPQVFNVQLRSVEDPNIIDDPNLRPHGHMQFKLTPNADGTFTLSWKGQIVNPGGESFTGWSMNDLDNGRPALLVAFGEVEGVSDRRIDPEDATIISAELAARLYGTPDTIDDPNIRVVFYSVERPLGALAGAR
jgi:hypothetical protein